MDLPELVKETKDTIAKVEGIINILRHDPVILVYNKMVGLKQKMIGQVNRIQAEIDGESAPAKNDNDSD